MGKDDCKYLSQEFDNDILYLVKQKEFYSCEYMSDFEKFKEELRSIEKFYSSLTNKKLSDKDYGHVLKVSNTFEMKKMKDHHELYLKCDVLLLAVFEKFRNSSLKNYGLCPSRFLSARALSWNAMLKMTKVELELISDVQMYLFPEKGMRGGLSYISKRYNEANKKYLKSLKSLNKNQKHIIYLGTNNLSGCTLSKFIPTGGFKRIDPKEFNISKPAIFQKVVFSKLILNIDKNDRNYIMIIH